MGIANQIFQGEEAIMPSVASVLQEDNGSFSSTRLAFLVWVLGVLVTWAAVSFMRHELQPVDSSVVTVLGILMTGKVVQKFGEKPAGAIVAAVASGKSGVSLSSLAAGIHDAKG